MFEEELILFKGVATQNLSTLKAIDFIESFFSLTIYNIGI